MGLSAWGGEVVKIIISSPPFSSQQLIRSKRNQTAIFDEEAEVMDVRKV